jgi:hypothetical protein
VARRRLDNPGVRRAAGAGRQDDRGRIERVDLVKGHLVVADHADVRVDGAQHLVQVVGKAV